MKERKLHVDAGENVHTILHYLYHFYHYQKALPSLGHGHFKGGNVSFSVTSTTVTIISEF